jgi:hypothetical protein
MTEQDRPQGPGAAGGEPPAAGGFASAPPPPPGGQGVGAPAQVPWGAPSVGVPAVGPAAGELAIKRSLIRCALATVVSFGVYSFWWFYQYRRRVSAELGKADDAGLHTAGLLVPFLNYYIIYLLWNDISQARIRVGLSDVPAVAYVIGSIFAAPIFYGIVNAQLNEYWDRRTGGRAIEAPWTTGEKLATLLPAAAFVGFLLLVMVIVGLAANS